jgi:hypothetical protein
MHFAIHLLVITLYQRKNILKTLHKKLSIILVCLTISNASWALNADKLKELGENYIQFMSAVGKGEEFTPRMPEIFHPDCQKIERGTPLFVSSNKLDEHTAQLQNAFEYIGNWTIEKLNVLAAPQDNACTIYFKWHSATFKPHATMAILYFDENGLITTIDEMYNEYQTKPLVPLDN